LADDHRSEVAGPRLFRRVGIADGLRSRHIMHRYHWAPHEGQGRLECPRWINLRHSQPCPECRLLGDKRTCRQHGPDFRI
jgi:hypothetical protein